MCFRRHLPAEHAVLKQTSGVLPASKNSTNEEIRYIYTGGAVALSADVISVTTTDYFHVAISYSKSSDFVKYYYDGSKFETDTGIGDWTYNGNLLSSRVMIGGRNTSSNYWDGDLDEVRIYNYALSEAEILKVYNSTK